MGKPWVGGKPALYPDPNLKVESKISMEYPWIPVHRPIYYI